MQRCIKLARTRIASIFQFMRYLVVAATANGTEASASAIAAQNRIASLKPSAHDVDCLVSMLTEAATAHAQNPAPIVTPGQ